MFVILQLKTQAVFTGDPPTNESRIVHLNDEMRKVTLQIKTLKEQIEEVKKKEQIKVKESTTSDTTDEAELKQQMEKKEQIKVKESTTSDTTDEAEQQELKKEVEKMNEELEKHIQEREKIQKQIDELNTQVISNKETADKAKDRADSAQYTADNIQQDVNELEDKTMKSISDLQQHMDTLEEKLDTLSKSVATNEGNNKEECRQAMQVMIEQTIQKQMANNKDECRQAMKDTIEETIQQQMADISGHIERQVSTAMESAMNKHHTHSEGSDTHTQHTNGEVIEELKKEMRVHQQETVRSIRSLDRKLNELLQPHRTIIEETHIQQLPRLRHRSSGHTSEPHLPPVYQLDSAMVITQPRPPSRLSSRPPYQGTDNTRSSRRHSIN